jgi:hypothetical protein
MLWLLSLLHSLRLEFFVLRSLRLARLWLQSVAARKLLAPWRWLDASIPAIYAVLILAMFSLLAHLAQLGQAIH